MEGVRVGPVRACRPTSEVSLGEQVLEEVRVRREQQVVQFVHAHPDHGVDVEAPAEVGAERLHLARCCDTNTKRTLTFWFFIWF